MRSRWSRETLFIAGLLASSAICATGLAEVSFNRDVKPILAEYCLHCHGPDKQNREADLRLDIADVAKRADIFAGNADESELIQRITTADEDLKMPPVDSKKILSEQDISILKQWVNEGAIYEGHWSFEPIREPAVPTPSINAAAPVTEIDQFILNRLESKGLNLSPPVSKQQLIRRASLDLIGLPPTWEEVQNFLNDDSPGAYEKVLDRLLASPRYGERWGRHWLDIARYADTHGGSAIGFVKFPFSYTYRDYTINAFNADLPVPRFILEQLAADQLGLEENDPALAGLGFLTVGMQFRSRHDVIDDQIDVTSRGLLGLTVACARCHDHKFDPIPTTDYYALYATFASSHTPEKLPLVGEIPQTPAYQEYARQLQKRQTIHEDMTRDQSEVMRSRLRMQVGLYLKELAKGTPEQDLSAAFLSYRTDDIRPLVLNYWRDYLAEMSPADPVFGPWVLLSKVEPQAFESKAKELLEAWKKENGDPEKFKNQQVLATAAPKWNPRVLAALAATDLKSLFDVANAYGNVFAAVHREWMTALLAASLEAGTEGEVVTDQDGRHAVVNSSIHSQLRRHLYEPGTPTCMDQATATTLLNRTVRDALRGKRGAIDSLQLNSPGSPPRAMMLEEAESTEPFHVFRRGNSINRGEVVEAHFLEALTLGDSKPEVFPAGQRRLALARSIVAPENPLFRRVIVNWVWRNHFGKGLARTPDDFGTRSQPPTYPALLDFLAVKLSEDGWSLKKLHKRIMLSQTYQQGAIENPLSRMKDPDNQLLWRMPRKRLSMEAMRDSLLAVSGELNFNQIGGRPFNFLSNPVVPRRSVYGFINRDIINSLSSTFDAANPTSCTAKRQQTTVPQQTLFALNSNFIQDRAQAFAKLALEIPDHAERVRYLYQRAFARNPEQAELDAALAFVAKTEEIQQWQQLAHVLLASNEFVFLD